MNRNIFLSIISLPISYSALISTDGIETMIRLADAMNQRMMSMKDVAGYKARHGVLIEDFNRERKVLDETKKEAEKSSLDPLSVTQFIQAQMDVGKAIQHRYFATWLSEPEWSWQPPDDLEDVRTTITNLDKTILHLISQQIRNENGFGEEQEKELMKRLTAPNITDGDRRYLVKSLNGIKTLQAARREPAVFASSRL